MYPPGLYPVHPFAAVAELFRKARATAPTVVFFDEVTPPCPSLTSPSHHHAHPSPRPHITMPIPHLALTSPCPSLTSPSHRWMPYPSLEELVTEKVLHPWSVFVCEMRAWPPHQWQPSPAGGPRAESVVARDRWRAAAGAGEPHNRGRAQDAPLADRRWWSWQPPTDPTSSTPRCCAQVREPALSALPSSPHAAWSQGGWTTWSTWRPLPSRRALADSQ